MLAKPIDPRHQTALDFGERSHWLQPWRAYLDTWPAARLSGGIGINFNVPPEEAETYAALLGNAGFRHARVEVPWASLRYDDPSRFQPPAEARYTTILTALRRHEIRPLILLNAHHGGACPLRRFDARVSGKAGSRTITLETDDPILPGRTGLDSRTTYLAAEYLVVAWNGSEAVLSKPLERDVDGMVTMTTLRYAPFDVPGTPGFEQTLAGWLQYVEAVSTFASTIVGPSGYDLEVWNEISFGSNFMDLGHYYERGAGRWIDAQGAALTRRTVEWARSSLSPGVGISDGFASQIPWPSGARNQAGDPQPLGLTALSKHLYAGAKTYPGGANPASVPLGALGTFTGGRMGSRLCCYFEPSYTAHFPEYYLSGLQTETAIRDLSPIPSSIHGRRHGRYTKPSGGTPPALWMTEINMEADDWEAKAKIALRYYVSWIGKGVERLYLFAAHESGGAFAVVDPEQAEGGHVLRALARLSGVLRTAQPITVPRPVSVAQIADSHGAFQFRGNDTAGYPPLYDREVLFVQPFQLADQRFLISVHVATRNALQPYSPKPFSITLAGVSGHTASLTAVDPLSGGPVPVTVLERDRRSIRFSLPVGDAPRLVTLVDEAVPRRHR